LLRPDRYFEAHDGSPPLKHAAIAVLAVAVATAVGLWLLLDQFAAALDVMVTVDNPAHPGDGFCGERSGSTDTPSGCAEPETIERNLGAIVVEEFSWLPPATLVIVPVWWLFQAGVLHLASAAVEGTGPFEDTLAVAGWGMVPSLLRMAGVMAFVSLSLQSISVPANPDGAVEAVRAALAGLEPVSLLLALLVAVWGGVIRGYGLAHARDLRLSTAAWVVGFLTVVGLLFELV
jgi:hypothetical protein